MKAGRSEVLGEHATNPAQPSIGGTSIETGWCHKCAKASSLKSNPNCPRCGVELDIKSWPVSGLEDRITAQFEQEVRRRARLAYMDLQRSDPMEASELRSLYSTDFSAGKYNWDDDGANILNHVRTARMQAWGAIYLLYLLMKRCNQAVVESDAKDVWLANPEDAMATHLWALGIAGNPKAPQKPAAELSPPAAQTTTPPIAATIG